MLFAAISKVCNAKMYSICFIFHDEALCCGLIEDIEAYSMLHFRESSAFARFLMAQSKRYKVNSGVLLSAPVETSLVDN